MVSMMQKKREEIKIESPAQLILDHLNINSVRNKFEAVTYLIDNKIDLLLISETKLDDSFSASQFQMKGFSVPYRYDRNGKGGGLLLYICEDIKSKLLISKWKWFLNCSYNPHQNLISNHLECLNRLIDGQFWQFYLYSGFQRIHNSMI